MIYKFLIGTVGIVAGLWLYGFIAGPQPTPQTTNTPLVGAFSPTGGGTYRLGQSIGTSDTSFKLSSFKEPVSNIPYTMAYLGSDIGYGTISPQSTISEFVSFTGITQNSDGSALLTGVSRGLSRTPGSGGCAASTTLAQSHAGQSIFILSNQPCFYVNEYVPLRTVATSSAVLVFGTTTMPRLDVEPTATQWNNATGTVFVTLNKLNGTAIAGASNATQAVNGISQLATGAQAGSSTLTGSTGGNLALSTLVSTSSPYTTGNFVPITMLNGKLKQAFYDLTELFAFTKATFTTATSTSFAVSGGALHLNGNNYRITSVAPTASTSVMATDASSNISWYQPTQLLYASNAQVNIVSTLASSTVFKTTIPGGALGADKVVRVKGQVSTLSADSAVIMYFDIGYGTASTTFTMSQSTGGNKGADAGFFEFVLTGAGATNSQRLSILLQGVNQGLYSTATGFFSKQTTGTFSQDSTVTQPLTFIVRPDTSGAGNQFKIESVTVESLR